MALRCLACAPSGRRFVGATAPHPAAITSARWNAFHELIGTLPADASNEPPAASTRPESESTSTTHFVVADAEGNVASVTQSLSHHFGAGVVTPGTGVVLNNSMKNFAVRDQSSVNYVAPGKRPRSTIAPTLVLRQGEPILALGVPGGQRIPTATLQVLLDVLVFRADLAEAIRRPRVHFRRPLRGRSFRRYWRLVRPGSGLIRRLAAVRRRLGR